jgi:hypothetical protein
MFSRRAPLSYLSPRALVTRTLLMTLAVFAVLEIWRPYYFLTDDNLSVGLPFLTEMGRHLKSGRSPFYSDYLFGGHYNLLRDVNYFSWSPVNFVVSLLADTPLRFAMLDLASMFNLALGAAGFILLAARVRKDLGLVVGDGRLLFLTMSFTFSTFILTTGASWANFLANQSVLPWLALGLWEAKWKRSLGLLVLFNVHQALAGQSAATVSNGLVLTFFAILLCFDRHSIQPLLCWAGSNLLMLVVISPLLVPALEGFAHSRRGAGLTVPALGAFSMPALLAPISLLFGNFFEMAAYFAHKPDASFFLFPRMPSLLACAAAWCVFPLLLGRRRWTLLEGGCALLIALLLVMVIRPLCITVFMAHLPVFRSMRWPFREILQTLFFFHLLLVLRPWAASTVLQNRVACVSLALFTLPLFFTQPLTLNPLKSDRALLFSGGADRYWNEVRQRLAPGERIATVIDPDMWFRQTDYINYTLTGVGDFPAYFQIPTVSGYSQTAPLDQLKIAVPAYFWFGAYSPPQLPEVRKAYPNVRIITVQSFHPLRLTLASVHGAAIDLTALPK